jgi:hypothetical protein
MTRKHAISRRQTLAYLAGAAAVGKIGPLPDLFPEAVAQQVPAFEKERRDAEILVALKKRLQELRVEGVTGIGPLEEDGAVCVVLVADPARLKLPETIGLELSDKTFHNVKLRLVHDAVPATLFYSSPQFVRPLQYHGPMMGGDPIWNNWGGWWGTITFAAGSNPIKIEGNVCAGQAVSCNHVVHVPGKDLLSTPNYHDSMTRAWNKVPTGPRWVDVAGANVNSGNPSPLEVRGLGKIKAAVQPQPGIRISKYGATTGLTSGRDLDLAWRALDDAHPTDTYLIRRASGYFAAKGDSGAPVVDASGNLVGMVVAGKSGVPDEVYYIQVHPHGEILADPLISAFEIEGL